MRASALADRQDNMTTTTLPSIASVVDLDAVSTINYGRTEWPDSSVADMQLIARDEAAYTYDTARLLYLNPATGWRYLVTFGYVGVNVHALPA